MLRISPEELFFLGKQMQARYIDYDYISMMKDIQQQYTLREKETMAGLVTRGMLIEDFSGDMELDEEVRETLEPLFFGEFASEIVIIPDRSGVGLERYKFHFRDGKITRVQVTGDGLSLTNEGSGELERLKELVIPKEYQKDSHEEFAMDFIKPDKVESVLILKNVTIRKETKVTQFVKMDGTWYVGKKENLAESLTREEMEGIWEQLTKGI